MRNTETDPARGRIFVCALGAAVAAALLAGCSSRGTESRSASPVPTSPATTLPVAVQTPPVTAPAEQPADSAEKPPSKLGYAALPPLEGEDWQALFDGKTLEGWKVTDFAGHGEVRVENGSICLDMGATLTGVNGTAQLPKSDYEIALDAMKRDGSDFFCGLTFPVGDSCCTLIVGGWGGGVVGISSIDGNDASMNETTKYMGFDQRRWYRIRVRVTKAKVEAWIGAQKVVDQDIRGRRISMRPGEIELSQPFGVAVWQTSASLRDIKWRPLPRE